jgi:hypothetical protein
MPSIGVVSRAQIRVKTTGMELKTKVGRYIGLINGLQVNSF